MTRAARLTALWATPTRARSEPCVSFGSALEPELVSISGRDRRRARRGARAPRMGGGDDRLARTGRRRARRSLRQRRAERPSRRADDRRGARGKHVLCEKPLALSADEAHTMWRAAEDAGVVHATGFNYRFVPAVRLARELVQSGELGEIVHFRARYLQSWGWDAGPTTGISTSRSPARARWATSARTRSTSRVTSSARSIRQRKRADVRSRPPGGRLVRRDGRVRDRRNGHTRSVAARTRTDQSQRLRAERDEGLGRIRPGANERAANLRRRRVPHGARARRMVAARAHHRLGRHVHVRIPPPAEGDRRRRLGRTRRRDVRGRLPLRPRLRRILRSSRSGRRETP